MAARGHFSSGRPALTRQVRTVSVPWGPLLVPSDLLAPFLWKADGRGRVSVCACVCVCVFRKAKVKRFERFPAKDAERPVLAELEEEGPVADERGRRLFSSYRALGHPGVSPT